MPALFKLSNKAFVITLLLGSHLALAQMDAGGDDLDADMDAIQEDDRSPVPGEETVFDEPLTDEPVADEGATPAQQPQAEIRPVNSDEIIFDWSKHQNATEVPHPFAEKGLLRITRDRTYIYRVDESEQRTAVQVRVGVYNPVNLTAPGADGAPPTSFSDNYDQTDSPTVMFDWEWQAWKSPIGKWGISAGAGAYVAQGNGRFAGTKNPGLTPKEVFTFAVVPVSLGAVYRLQIWRRQLFVPYGAGGGVGFAFGEFRDDSKPPKWGGVFGTYFAAGLAMSLSYFDSLARIQLDREYGINAIYLTAEYRTLISLNQNYDFGSEFVNGGFLLEY